MHPRRSQRDEGASRHLLVADLHRFFEVDRDALRPRRTAA
jgi:hypothetical protein